MSTPNRTSIARRYPVTLSFVRKFTRGTLEGLTHEDAIGFCNENAAADWVRAVNAQASLGRVNYVVVSHVIERN